MFLRYKSGDFLVHALTLLLALAFISAPAMAQTSLMNNADQVLASLPNMTQQERFQFYQTLQNQLKIENDEQQLRSALDFLNRAFALEPSLDHEDWMLLRPAQIANQLLERLLTSTLKPADTMIADYGALIGDNVQATHFAVLSYWQNQLAQYKLQTLPELAQLLKFTMGARQISQLKKEEAWVPGLADRIAQLTSTRMLRIRPVLEGVYDVTAQCSPKETHCFSPGSLSILIGDDAHGISIAFVDLERGSLSFDFSNAEFIDGHLIKASANSPAPGQLELNFDLGYGSGTGSGVVSVTGTLRTPRLQAPMVIVAKQRTSTAQLYETRIKLSRDTEVSSKITYLPSAQNIEGAYDGTLLEKIPVTLTLQKISEQDFAATIRNANTGDVLFEYGHGSYFDSLGLLTLFSYRSGKPVKLTLRYTPATPGTPAQWVGLGQSLFGGKIYDLKFNATSPASMQ